MDTRIEDGPSGGDLPPELRQLRPDTPRDDGRAARLVAGVVARPEAEEPMPRELLERQLVIARSSPMGPSAAWRL